MFNTTSKGLFGAPMMADASLTRQLPVPSPDSPYKRPSTGQMIAGTIGDALQTWGGGKATFLPAIQEQRKAALESQQYQMKRADEYTDWERKQQYEAAHPNAAKDSEFTRTLQAAGIDPASPEARQLYRTRATTMAYPTPTYVSNGPGLGGGFVTPPLPGMTGPSPQAPVGKLTPLGGGGAASQGPRTFPVR